ncbi:hypothetical protein SESBI_30796 [Sesbania bispinosa]|nr:hypothetical protein SESBI_30796 [Sesbania bispinosa]
MILSKSSPPAQSSMMRLMGRRTSYAPLSSTNVAVTNEVVHGLDFRANIVNVVVVDKFAGDHGFAGKFLFLHFVCDQVGDVKLASTKLVAKDVDGANIFHGATEDATEGGAGWLWFWEWGRLGRQHNNISW